MTKRTKLLKIEQVNIVPYFQNRNRNLIKITYLPTLPSSAHHWSNAQEEPISDQANPNSTLRATPKVATSTNRTASHNSHLIFIDYGGLSTSLVARRDAKKWSEARYIFATITDPKPKTHSQVPSPSASFAATSSSYLSLIFVSVLAFFAPLAQNSFSQAQTLFGRYLTQCLFCFIPSSVACADVRIHYSFIKLNWLELNTWYKEHHQSPISKHTATLARRRKNG